MEERKGQRLFFDLELGFFVMLIGLAALFFVTSLNYPATMGMFPRMMSVVIMVLGLVELYRKFTGRTKANGKKHECKGTPWYIIYAFAVGYVVLVLLFGFAVGTFVICAGVPPVLGYRKWPMVGAFAVITTALVFWVCQSIFMIRLPAGLIFG